MDDEEAPGTSKNADCSRERKEPKRGLTGTQSAAIFASLAAITGISIVFAKWDGWKDISFDKLRKDFYSLFYSEEDDSPPAGTTPVPEEEDIEVPAPAAQPAEQAADAAEAQSGTSETTPTGQDGHRGARVVGIVEVDGREVYFDSHSGAQETTSGTQRRGYVDVETGERGYFLPSGELVITSQASGSGERGRSPPPLAHENPFATQARRPEARNETRSPAAQKEEQGSGFYYDEVFCNRSFISDSGRELLLCGIYNHGWYVDNAFCAQIQGRRSYLCGPMGPNHGYDEITWLGRRRSHDTVTPRGLERDDSRKRIRHSGGY